MGRLEKATAWPSATVDSPTKNQETGDTHNNAVVVAPTGNTKALAI